MDTWPIQSLPVAESQVTLESDSDDEETLSDAISDDGSDLFMAAQSYKRNQQHVPINNATNSDSELESLSGDSSSDTGKIKPHQHE